MTRGNMGLAMRQMARLPGEDRSARLAAALQCSWEAFTIFIEMKHEFFILQAADNLIDLGVEAGDRFADLWRSVADDDPPDWLSKAISDRRNG